MKIAFTKKGLDKIVDRELRKMDLDEISTRSGRFIGIRKKVREDPEVIEDGYYEYFSENNYEPAIPIIKRNSIPQVAFRREDQFFKNGGIRKESVGGSFDRQYQLVVLKDGIHLQRIELEDTEPCFYDSRFNVWEHKIYTLFSSRFNYIPDPHFKPCKDVFQDTYKTILRGITRTFLTSPQECSLRRQWLNRNRSILYSSAPMSYAEETRIIVVEGSHFRDLVYETLNELTQEIDFRTLDTI